MSLKDVLNILSNKLHCQIFCIGFTHFYIKSDYANFIYENSVAIMFFLYFLFQWLTDQPIRYSLLTSFDRNDAGMLFIYCQIRKKSYPVSQKIEGNFESILQGN